MSSPSLPFQRGDTYFGGSNIDPNAASHLEGRRFCVTDDRHGTGQTVELMVVRANSDLALGTANNRYRGVMFGSTAGWLGRKVRGLVDGIGKFGVPVDDAYTSDIKSGDLFYVVVKGPVKIRRAGNTTAVAGSLSAGTLVSFTTGGRLVANAAGRVPIGRLTETIASGATGTASTKVVLVDYSESAIE